MIKIPEYIAVAFASTLKFVGGPLAGLAMDLTWWETSLFSAIGMMLTVILVVYGGGLLKAVVNSFKKNRTRKVFTKTNRTAVKVKSKLGLWGIAILTPFIFTPILGSYLALSFRFNKIEILWKMFVCALIAGSIQTLFFYFVKDLFV